MDKKHAPRSANPVDVHVGTRVRLRRQVLKMSQERLGDQLGVTFQQVQKYERGANRLANQKQSCAPPDSRIGAFTCK